MKYYTLAYYNESVYGIEGWNEGTEIFKTKKDAKIAIIKYYRDLLTKYYATPMTKHQIYEFESRTNECEAERIQEEYAYNNELAKYKIAAPYINGVTKIRIYTHEIKPVVANLSKLYKINVTTIFNEYSYYINSLVEDIIQYIGKIDNKLIRNDEIIYDKLDGIKIVTEHMTKVISKL